MASNEYRFITHWRVNTTAEEVFDILSDAEDLARWWPAVYLTVQVLAAGDKNGIGKTVSLFTKGWLPYTLRWQFRITEVNKPFGFALKAWGDFDGRGIWTFEPDGEAVKVIYDWQIRADKPLLRALSWLFKPIFSANHRWAMAKGEESLKLEIARRHDTNAGGANLPPPGPTFPHNLTYRKKLRQRAPV
ncbi:MAG: hypothetical protein ALAOOOJD_00011 [bacterium]|nr:hypothetical protein [bacterium]